MGSPTEPSQRSSLRSALIILRYWRKSNAIWQPKSPLYDDVLLLKGEVAVAAHHCFGLLRLLLDLVQLLMLQQYRRFHDCR
jgi:hypothetical protein